ncbi:MAG TPA: class I SAM-dependent methyltransferase [Chryseolinea sp.]
MIRLIIYSLKRFAWFKRLNAKVTYEVLAKRVPAAEWQFMNYGYVPNANESPLNLPEDPKIQKYPLQMYHYLALQTEVEGKAVLEVGSGRGGGAKHIASTLKPASYIGMDLAQNAVDLANKLHNVPNLKFIQGSAEAIPLPDNSIDVVLNVESCHAYGNVEKFISEVKRVLKPEGVLALVDFRDAEQMNVLRKLLKGSGLQFIAEENIGSNVIQAIEAEDDVKKARIEKLFPPKWQKLFGEFAGVVGSKFYTKLKSGTKVYHRFLLKKAL